jgi:hypothetical protein
MPTEKITVAFFQIRKNSEVNNCNFLSVLHSTYSYKLYTYVYMYTYITIYTFYTYLI